MSKKESKDLVVASGLCTIGGTIAHAKQTKRWRAVHTFFTILGAGLTIYGAVA